jgi:hypothetical protein
MAQYAIGCESGFGFTRKLARFKRLQCEAGAKSGSTSEVRKGLLLVRLFVFLVEMRKPSYLA